EHPPEPYWPTRKGLLSFESESCYFAKLWWRLIGLLREVSTATGEDMFAVHKPEYAPSLAGSRTHTPVPQQRASVPQEDTVPPLFMPHHTRTPQPFISPLHPVRSPNTSECSAIAVSQLQSPPQAVSAHQEISQHQSMTPHHFGQQVMSGVLLAPPPQTLAPVSSDHFPVEGVNLPLSRCVTAPIVSVEPCEEMSARERVTVK
ncbi:hypothetical protein FB446DRAFT_709408, partial [Lentinula raphanica]